MAEFRVGKKWGVVSLLICVVRGRDVGRSEADFRVRFSEFVGL